MGLKKTVKKIDPRARSNVQVSNRADAVQAVLERGKGRRLRQQHEQAVQALVQVRVLLRFQQLQP